MFRPTRPAGGPAPHAAPVSAAAPDPGDAEFAPPAGRGRRALALAFVAAAAAACGCCARPYQPYGAVPNYYGGAGAPGQQQQFGAPGYGQPAPSFGPQPVPGNVPAGGTYLGSPGGGVPVLPAPDSNFGSPGGGDFGGGDFGNGGGFGGAPSGGFDDGGFGNGGFGDGGSGGAPGGGPYYGDEGFGAAPANGNLPPADPNNYSNPDAFDIDRSPGDGAGNGVDNLGPPGGDAFDLPPGYQDPEPGDFNTGLAPRPRRRPRRRAAGVEDPAPQ